MPQRVRGTDVVVLVSWMLGAMFALWLTWTARVTALALQDMGPDAWTSVLLRVPWIAIWLAVAVALAVLAWPAAWFARRIPWLSYGYAVVVVLFLAVLYWAAIVQPVSGVLLGA